MLWDFHINITLLKKPKKNLKQPNYLHRAGFCLPRPPFSRPALLLSRAEASSLGYPPLRSVR